MELMLNSSKICPNVMVDPESNENPNSVGFYALCALRRDYNSNPKSVKFYGSMASAYLVIAIPEIDNEHFLMDLMKNDIFVESQISISCIRYIRKKILKAEAKNCRDRRWHYVMKKFAITSAFFADQLFNKSKGHAESNDTKLLKFFQSVIGDLKSYDIRVRNAATIGQLELQYSPSSNIDSNQPHSFTRLSTIRDEPVSMGAINDKSNEPARPIEMVPLQEAAQVALKRADTQHETAAAPIPIAPEPFQHERTAAALSEPLPLSPKSPLATFKLEELMARWLQNSPNQDRSEISRMRTAAQLLIDTLNLSGCDATELANVGADAGAKLSEATKGSLKDARGRATRAKNIKKLIDFAVELGIDTPLRSWTYECES